MRKPVLKICSIIGLFLITFVASHADRIILKEGKELQCRILFENEDEVRIDMEGMELSIPTSRIREKIKEYQS